MSRRKTPRPFDWRGITLLPVEDCPTVWRSEPIALEENRISDWRVEQLAAGSGWHARLKIGADRFPGVGRTAGAALEAAAAEASTVASFIVALRPPATTATLRRPAGGSGGPSAARPRRGMRTRKVTAPLIGLSRLNLGRRVYVRRAYGGGEVGIWGVVVRLRRADRAAWIRLDHRHPLCPFPADDKTRSAHIVAWPGDCFPIWPVGSA